MELSKLVSRSGHSGFVAQRRSSIPADCRSHITSLSLNDTTKPKTLTSTFRHDNSSKGGRAQFGRRLEVQRLVKCEGLQEGQVGSVEEKTAFAGRLENGAEDYRQSGSHDDGLARAKLAVFVSGGGSNFRAIHAGCKENAILGDVAFVVSDKPGITLSLLLMFHGF